MGAERAHQPGEPEVGTVVSLKGKRMLVRLPARQQCASCGARHLCTVTNEEARELILPNTVGARAGETVEVVVQPKVKLAGAFLVFTVPVLLGLVGYGVGRLLFGAEKPAVVATMGGFVLGLVVAWVVDRLTENRRESPVRVRRLG
ncbi:MAG: SoxR reducing system RseC family protein [candidate division KSB1 bacterium]|nr:SoxR reducing system RseC family protein [candidate division KSB1 bacterium]